MAQNVSYEAGLERDYSLLTEKHKSAVEKLESSLSVFLKSGKGKPVTIQGPYGSGKTQLLYHLYKYVWARNWARN
jgi:ABC-type lipoprotein export system ATPase subunit